MNKLNEKFIREFKEKHNKDEWDALSKYQKLSEQIMKEELEKINNKTDKQIRRKNE